MEAAKNSFATEPWQVLKVASAPKDVREAIVQFISPCRRLGFEADSLPYAKHSFLSALLPEIEVAPFYLFEKPTNPIRNFSRAKTQSEIEALNEAQKMSQDALLHALEFVKPGVAESEIAARIEYYMKMRGAQGTSFDSIVASGPRSALPHGKASSDKLIVAGETIQFDVGAKSKGYCGDISWVVSLGEPTDEQLRIHKIISNALRFSLALCQPGNNCREMYYEVDRFLRPYVASGQKDALIHALGHGIGLEPHGLPYMGKNASDAIKDMKLEVGDVLTIEPGLYFPGKGGMRLEQMVAITENGPEVLGHKDFPIHELRIIPA